MYPLKSKKKIDISAELWDKRNINSAEMCYQLFLLSRKTKTSVYCFMGRKLENNNDNNKR